MRARVPTPRSQELSKIEGEEAKNIRGPYKLRRYYTPADIAKHNTTDDCWVSFFN
jgi:cytochrome b involved in lipid metabolism